jgi:hypothetical protein
VAQEVRAQPLIMVDAFAGRLEVKAVQSRPWTDVPGPIAPTPHATPSLRLFQPHVGRLPGLSSS